MVERGGSYLWLGLVVWGTQEFGTANVIMNRDFDCGEVDGASSVCVVVERVV